MIGTHFRHIFWFFDRERPVAIGYSSQLGSRWQTSLAEIRLRDFLLVFSTSTNYITNHCRKNNFPANIYISQDFLELE